MISTPALDLARQLEEDESIERANILLDENGEPILVQALAPQVITPTVVAGEWCTVCRRTHARPMGETLCCLRPARRSLVEWLLWALR